MKFGFVTKSDVNYFPGLHNLINSLQITNPDIPITVLDCGLTNNQIKLIVDRVKTIIKIDISDYSIKVSDLSRFSPAIYGAMYLDKVDYDIIFHMDSDLVVLDDVIDVFVRCNELGFVGVSDFPPLDLQYQLSNEIIQRKILERYPNINFNMKSFNGGVFCISKAFFVRQLLPKIKEFSDLHKEFKTNDQALLNLAYASLGYKKFYDLGLVYNFRPKFSRDKNMCLDNPYITTKKILSALHMKTPIKILHFIRTPKPWYEEYDKKSLSYKIWSQFS